jgi:RNA polymerase sigma-70 factor (ECF subfamily)
MLALAREILGSAREADECVHETLLEAWHRARFYRAVDGPVGSWLQLRVRSRALERARAIGADQAAPVLALAWLPDVQRSVLELAYFRGYSCPEIAVRLGLSLAIVQMHLAAAFVLLKQRQGERP